MKDEKILKKVAKLLKLYGVEEDEKINGFLDDLKEMKDEEDEVVEEGEKLEKPTENEDVKEEITETEKVEENPAEPEPEQPQEEVAKESEEIKVEEEQPAEKEGEPETTANEYDFKEKYEELVKTTDALSSRLESLENVVSKLGVPIEDETLGASPTGTPVDEQPNDSFNHIMNKRIGK